MSDERPYDPRPVGMPPPGVEEAVAKLRAEIASQRKLLLLLLDGFLHEGRCDGAATTALYGDPGFPAAPSRCTERWPCMVHQKEAYEAVGTVLGTGSRLEF